jgi:hypothetical protein
LEFSNRQNGIAKKYCENKNGRIRNQLLVPFESQMFPMKKIIDLKIPKFLQVFFPATYKQPTIDPALVPAIGHGSCSSRNLINLHVLALDPPPERTSPIDFVLNLSLLFVIKWPFWWN